MSIAESELYFQARILLQRGDIAGALAVMTKIYAFAKHEEVYLKVCRNHPIVYLTFLGLF